VEAADKVEGDLELVGESATAGKKFIDKEMSLIV
jgi:hypothetical protein